MKKVKVAFFSRALHANGATKSLIELLKRVNLNDCEIDLYILDFTNQTDWVNELPKKINIILVNKYYFSKIMLYNIIRHPIHFINSLYSSIQLKRDISYVKSLKYTAARYPIIDKCYDIAISYRHFDIDVFFVINNLKAKNKYFWIHGVQPLTKEEIFELKKIYKKYNNVFPVSWAARKNILRYIPEIKDRCIVAYNVVDENEIKCLSKKGENFLVEYETEKKKWNILTVARLSKEKGIYFALDTCMLLKNMGCNFKWYIIGDGVEKYNLDKKIKEHSLEDYFILMGYVPNPYGYFSSCDIYVQPSFLESYGLAINEAKIFHKPIVATDIDASKEQLVQNKTGVLVSHDEKEMANAIYKLMNDTMFKEKIVSNLYLENNNHFECIEIFNNLVKNIDK